MNFESESLSERDVEALGVVRFVGENRLDGAVCRFWFRIQRIALRGHFEEAVDDEEEFLDIGGNNSASDIFLTLATDFLTDALALEHLFRN